jgi:hypothetical protein
MATEDNYRANDDGEPVTAQVTDLIKSTRVKMSDILVVVTRIFRRDKIRSRWVDSSVSREAARQALDQAEVVKRIIITETSSYLIPAK